MTIGRILLSTDAVGGVWTYTVDLARALRDHGVEPIIATMGPSPQDHQHAQAAGIRILDTRLPLDWLADDPQQVCTAGRALAQLASEVHADVVQLHSAALACNVQFRQPVVAVQHSCVATWWDAVRDGPLPQDFAWRKEGVECGLNNVEAIVAPTAAFAAQTARVYSCSRSIHAVHNGRWPIALPNRPHGDFVLTVGRLWDEGKNLAALDQAAAVIDAPFEAIGPTSGPNGASMNTEHMRSLGVLSDSELAERLAARPIFASAARYEPFGLSVLEAAQAGCALVLSNIPTFCELWTGAALFVSADDAGGFALIINELLRDPELREQLGRAAQLKSLDYTPERNVRRMLQIYEQVAPVAQARHAIAGAA